MTRRVLLVEDDAIARRELAEVLEENGWDVVQAGNGVDALRLLEQADRLPAVVLLDLNTPGMDGWEFRDRQLSNPRIRRVPIIPMSGESNLALHASELGAPAYLSKPFGLDALLSTLDRVAFDAQPIELER